MSTASRPRLLTAEEFMLTPDLGEGLHELVRGRIVFVGPPPELIHGFVCAKLAYFLWEYGRRTGYGRGACNYPAVLTARDPDSLRGPDLVFHSRERCPNPCEAEFFPPVAPDLTVEVVSRRDRPSELRVKIDEYLAAGVLAVWVVNPASRTVVIHRPARPVVHLKMGDAIEGPPELPGFRRVVSEIFDY